MPATQNCRLDDWHEPPFLGTNGALELIPDSRVFNPSDPQDIATCLLEDDPQIEAHRWVLTDQQLAEMALESAKVIVANREERYIDNVVHMRFEKAKAERRVNEAGRKLAVVVSFAQNLKTGETTVSENQLSLRRSFG